MFCESKEKAIVKYKFGDRAEMSYQTFDTPIEIKNYTRPVGRTENFIPSGYLFRAYSTNNNNWFEWTLLDYYIVDRDPSFTEYDSLPIGSTNSKYAFRYAMYSIWCDGGERSINLDPRSISLDYTKKCSTPVKNACYLEIFDKTKDTLIFRDQGLCPCTFEVQCGDCPPGQIRCDSPGYPGYCCISCAELAQRVDALAKRI